TLALNDSSTAVLLEEGVDALIVRGGRQPHYVAQGSKEVGNMPLKVAGGELQQIVLITGAPSVLLPFRCRASVGRHTSERCSRSLDVPLDLVIPMPLLTRGPSSISTQTSSNRVQKEQPDTDRDQGKRNLIRRGSTSGEVSNKEEEAS